MRTVVVDGEPLVIPGFEEFEFFTHSPIPDDRGSFAVVISEKSTSAAVGTGWSFDEAYEDALKNLNSTGVDGLKGRIAATKIMVKRIMGMKIKQTA